MTVICRSSEGAASIDRMMPGQPSKSLKGAAALQSHTCPRLRRNVERAIAMRAPERARKASTRAGSRRDSSAIQRSFARSTHLGDLTLLHQERARGAADQGWPMRHHDAGDRHLLDQIRNRRFRLLVEVGGAFVEQEDPRLAMLARGRANVVSGWLPGLRVPETLSAQVMQRVRIRG